MTAKVNIYTLDPEPTIAFEGQCGSTRSACPYVRDIAPEAELIWKGQVLMTKATTELPSVAPET